MGKVEEDTIHQILSFIWEFCVLYLKLPTPGTSAHILGGARDGIIVENMVVRESFGKSQERTYDVISPKRHFGIILNYKVSCILPFLAASPVCMCQDFPSSGKGEKGTP